MLAHCQDYYVHIYGVIYICSIVTCLPEFVHFQQHSLGSHLTLAITSFTSEFLMITMGSMIKTS